MTVVGGEREHLLESGLGSEEGSVLGREVHLYSPLLYDP